MELQELTFVRVLPLQLCQPLCHVEDLILGVTLIPQLLHSLFKQMGFLSLQPLDCILVLLQILIQCTRLTLVEIIHTTIYTFRINDRFQCCSIPVYLFLIYH